jgi:hypothetical protein
MPALLWSPAYIDPGYVSKSSSLRPASPRFRLNDRYKTKSSSTVSAPLTGPSCSEPSHGKRSSSKATTYSTNVWAGSSSAPMGISCRGIGKGKGPALRLALSLNWRVATAGWQMPPPPHKALIPHTTLFGEQRERTRSCRTALPGALALRNLDGETLGRSEDLTQRESRPDHRAALLREG